MFLIIDITEYDGNTTNRIVGVLNGHVKSVRCLFWSCYENGKLVSCGNDGVAQVMFQTIYLSAR